MSRMPGRGRRNRRAAGWVKSAFIIIGHNGAGKAQGHRRHCRGCARIHPNLWLGLSENGRVKSMDMRLRRKSRAGIMDSLTGPKRRIRRHSLNLNSEIAEIIMESQDLSRRTFIKQTAAS